MLQRSILLIDRRSIGVPGSVRSLLINFFIWEIAIKTPWHNSFTKKSQSPVRFGGQDHEASESMNVRSTFPVKNKAYFIQTLLQAHFCKFSRLSHIRIFGNGHLRLIHTKFLKYHNGPYILREIRWHSHFGWMHLVAIFVRQVLNEFNTFQGDNFLVMPDAVPFISPKLFR